MSMSIPVKPCKPCNEVKRVVNCLLAYSNQIRYRKNLRVNCNDSLNPQCVLLISGETTIVRDDGLILGVVRAPMILGQTAIFGYSASYTLAINSDAIAYKISAIEAEKIIQENNLWRDMVHIASYIISSMVFREYYFVGRSSYSQIKTCLLSISSKYNCDNINVPKYIMDRTFLSRSTVMKILRELKKGGYIFLCNGKKLKIKKLPEDY